MRIKTLIVCMLLPLLLVPGLVQAGTLQPPLPSTEDGSGLVTVSYDLALDEAESKLTAELLLKNTLNSEYKGWFTLPDSEYSAHPESLMVRIDGEPVYPAEGKYLLQIPAGGYKTVVWNFDTVNLRDVSVISCDLNGLIFTEGSRIGKVHVAFTLEDRDIPLVKEITPVNFTLEGSTVNVTLYDIKPSCLLDRVCIVKDTWKELRYSREYEPNEAQRFLLDHFDEWRQSGGLPGMGDTYIGDLFNMAMGIPEDMDWEEQQHVGFSSLDENTDAYMRLVYDLYYQRQILQCTDDGPSLSGIGSTVPILRGEIYAGMDPYYKTDIFCVRYVRNPALAGEELYVLKTVEIGWDDDTGLCDNKAEWVRCTDVQALTSDISGNWKTISTMPSHIAVIPPDSPAGGDEVADFVKAIGARMLICMTLYDGRTVPYPSYVASWNKYDDNGEIIPGEFETHNYECRIVVGYYGKENLEIAKKACTWYDSEEDLPEEQRSIQFIETDDPLLAMSEVPAIMLYRGSVREEEGQLRVSLGDAIHYQSDEVGFAAYSEVASCERGKALLEAFDKERSAVAADMDAEISEQPVNVSVSEPETYTATVPPETTVETEPALTEEPDQGDTLETTVETEPALIAEPARGHGHTLEWKLMAAALIVSVFLVLSAGALLILIIKTKKKR